MPEWISTPRCRRSIIFVLSLWGQSWFRDLDSNQDTQLQRLMSYRLDDPGIDSRIVAEPPQRAQTNSCPKNILLETVPHGVFRNVRVEELSVKLVELFPSPERWPSGLRRTLGKRV